MGLVYYLNFKLGHSLADVPLDFREVRERDYFFTVGFSVWGLMAGVGIASLWDWIRRRSGRSLAFGAPVLGLAFIPLVLNFSWASRAGDHSSRDWAYNLLMSVEPYGLIFTNGDNDTFPLWYLQEVEGIRRDVTVAVTSYLNTDWYVKQLRDLTRPCGPGEDPDADPTRIVCQRPYTADNTDAMYTHSPAEAEAADKVPITLWEPARVPTRSIFAPALTDARIEEAARQYTAIDSVQSFNLGSVTATMVGHTNLLPWHLFAMSAIANSIGDRPVYFASSGSAALTFGLRRHLVRQGLAFRLVPGSPGQYAEFGVVPNLAYDEYAGVVGPWVDVVRTGTLADEVFMHRNGIPEEWNTWKDKSTIGIPNYYSWVYRALEQWATESGDDETAARYRAHLEAWARLGDDLDD